MVWRNKCCNEYEIYINVGQKSNICVVEQADAKRANEIYKELKEKFQDKEKYIELNSNEFPCRRRLVMKDKIIEIHIIKS